MINPRIVICILVVFCLTACEGKEHKIRRMVWEQFDTQVLADLREHLPVYMEEAFYSKRTKEITDASLATQLWQLVDSSYAPADTSVRAHKWKFWEEVMEAPDSHVARTRQGKVFLEYDISSIGEDPFYYSAMVKIPYWKGDRRGLFRIFYLWTPEQKWREVDYEFDWPNSCARQVPSPGG